MDKKTDSKNSEERLEKSPFWELRGLLRKNIQSLEPYSCARDKYKGEASVYLDANENPSNAPNNH